MNSGNYAIKVLVLSRYDRRGASSRLRTLQYLPYLSKDRMEVRVESLFQADYLETMYAGRRSARIAGRSLLNRMRRMRQQADVIWLEKEALPWIPWVVEKLFWSGDVPVVTDYDDAIFHRYDENNSFVARGLLGQKIDRVMRSSALVMAGNEYLSDRAKNAGAKNIEIVPTVVDRDAYKSSLPKQSDGQLRLGWIGTPESWVSLARSFSATIGEMASQEGALFRVVGGETCSRIDGALEYLPWSEESEISLLGGMDIGIMPLPDTPWARGKCGYKLIQYMACGLPVVAAPVGVNCDIVEHGVNGFLADTDEEWRVAIKTLLNDAELRRRMGAAGRQKVEQHYSLQVWGPRVAQMLRSVAEGRIS